VGKLHFVLDLSNTQLPVMCGVHLFFVGLKQTEGKSRYGRGFSRYSRQHSIDPGGIKIFTGTLVKSQMTSELMRIL